MSAVSSETNESSPLTPAVFAILLALADGEKHGYAIMQEAREHTPMGPGTLYGSLDRLLASGMVEETGVDGDARRRFYKLTDGGVRALALETVRLERASARARAKGVRSIEVRA
ncbi:PadR family transcriptional regulator [Granulicella sibirica]|uniref:Transcriptional regulator, PadR family n=1 Tax=Granulicella sibirica TaxID=2479048 RepID=A0A4Q0T9H7_9BACT|nr:helix-turn-helix transcriptional regulator [Granulicella sibirica]RXH58768.1 Transcriptional regulator, PadR family [Granulicella sibirica]